jgi:hypothetical protein
MADHTTKHRRQLPSTEVKERPLIKHAVDADASRGTCDSQREPVAPLEKYQMAVSNALLSFGA